MVVASIGVKYGKKFKIDLIVWKFKIGFIDTWYSSKFKIDLIVWKSMIEVINKK